MSETGKPTAKKVRGTGFYMPAVTTEHGPKPLLHGDRQDTRWAAIREAKKILKDATHD